MVAVAVTFDGTRLDDSDANTDWSNFPSGGQAPSAEANNKYQGANVVNQKLSSTSLDGLSYLHPSTTDMTAANRNLFYAKIYVTDFGALDATYGLSASIGLDASNRRNYNVGGTGSKISRFNTYPARGGYLIAPINPSVTGWIDNTTGTVSAITAIDFFGAQADWLASASAKSENFCLDAIDVGSGLTLLNGTGADTPGDFTDFVATDQDQVTTGRWGVCFGAGTFVEAQGMLNIGSATATEFDDQTSQVLFLDSYVAAGDFGVTCDIQNASSIIDIGCTITGLGAVHTEADTRPDHIVSGTSGSYTLTGTLSNHRNVTFTSACTVDGATIECALLTQGSADIENCTILSTALTSVACLQDPTFGTTTDLNNTTFVQNGAGHAIEIDTAGDYTFTNLFFEDGTGTWGATTSDSAMIDVTAGTGTVNISVSGGTAAVTYKSAGATVNIIASVNVKVANVTRGTPVKLIARETLGAVTAGDVLSEQFANNLGEIDYSHNDQGSLDIQVVARNQGVAVAAIADDGGTFVDETTEASSNTTADMTLLPTTPVVGDAYYFGHDEQFTRLKLDVSTAQTKGTAVTWEYWNGTGWTALSGVTDGTSSFANSGANIVSWTLPGNWGTTSVTNQANTGAMYYVRARVTTAGQPGATAVGRKVTLDVSRYLPYDELREIVTGVGLTDNAAWRRDTISKFDPSD